MKRILLTLILGAGISGAQTFFSDEEFYGYLENRQRMAIAEAQARAWAREQQVAAEARAKESKHQEVMKMVSEELDNQALEAIQWLRANRRCAQTNPKHAFYVKTYPLPRE